MKVLHVVDMIDPSSGGGTAERSFQMATALVRAGKQCVILCTDVGLSDERRQMLAGVELVAVRTISRRFLIPLISRSRISRLVEAVDVIHAMGHWSFLVARVCLEAQSQGKPYVYSPAGSLRIYGRSKFLKYIFNWVYGWRVLQGAARFIAVTDMEFEQFRECGLPEDRFVTLPNGINPDDNYKPDPELFRNFYSLNGCKIILFLGRLNPIKGPDLLITAFGEISQYHSDARLVIAGPDEGMGSALKALAKQLGISSRVLFIGFIGGHVKQDALAAASLLVVPSRQEAMSLVALEAGLCGTPVLLTDQCGFDEVMAVGGGVVVKATSEALAVGLNNMLGAIEVLPSQGQKLRELVISRYTWDGLSCHICGLYDELIKG